MPKVILIGTSAAGKVAHHALSHDPRYEVVAFSVDRAYIKADTFCGLPVVPFEEVQDLYPPSEHQVLVAIWAGRMNRTRAEKYEQAKAKGYTLISYVHPTAVVPPDLEMGDHCFISEGAILRPYLKIGNNVVVMPGAALGHDSVIKDHCFIGSRAMIMGAVTLEPYCFLGPGAIILEAVTVARECLIGGGVVIQENTKEKEVYKAPAPVLLPVTSDKLARFVFRRTL